MKLEINALQFRILRELCFGEYRKIDDLAGALDKSLTRASIALKDLEEKGIVDVERQGLSKRPVFSGNKHAALLKAFISEHFHMKIEEVLAGSALEVLLPLAYEKLDTSEIVEISELSESTVRRNLKKLGEVGIVVRGYTINPRHRQLKEFIKEFQGYINQQTAISFARDSVILWQRGKEFLVKTKKEKEGKYFLLTGFSKMGEFGIPLILRGFYYYFYSPFKKAVGMEDAALHVLVTEPSSTTNVLYALLLAAKNQFDMDYFKKEGKKFGLENTAMDIEKYIETRGEHKPRFFPRWEEFKSKAGEYEIWL
jgi:DNA-binding transcriptional ArsR family regulator